MKKKSTNFRADFLQSNYKIRILNKHTVCRTCKRFIAVIIVAMVVVIAFVFAVVVAPSTFILYGGILYRNTKTTIQHTQARNTLPNACKCNIY